MENQINVGDQNTQQAGQHSVDQPVAIQAKPKTNYLMIGVMVLLCFVVFGFGGYYLGKQSFRGLTGERKIQTSPTPSVTETVPITDWKTFQSKEYTFKYPNDWQQGDTNSFGSRSVTEFHYQNGTPLSFSIVGNYNQVTGKAHKTLDEYLGEAAEKAVNIQIAGYPAKLIDDPGEEGHVIPFQRTVMFSINKAEILDFYYQSSYYQRENTQNVLTQILTTFKILNNQAPTSATSSSDWKTYQTNNFSIKYPSEWNITTKQIEYYDPPTLVLTKEGGKKTWGGYELPQLWIGSFEIYSTSGAICANEPYCEKVDKISFSIKGKNYSTDVFKRQNWESGKFTGNYFYVFQIGANSELDFIPSKPTITGQFETTAEKSEIENILSSINY